MKRKIVIRELVTGPLLAPPPPPPLLAVEFSNTEGKFQNYSMYLCRQACTHSPVIFYHELDALYDLKILPSGVLFSSSRYVSNRICSSLSIHLRNVTI